MKRAHPLFAAVLLLATMRSASAATAEVSVSSSHLRVGDLIADLDSEAAAIDLGPSPAAGGSRVVDRDEILRAFREHGMDPPHVVPVAMRVVRKMQRIDRDTISSLVRTTLGENLPRGVTLTDVHATRASIPDGWTRTTCEIPRPPHKTGPLTSSANLTFFEGDQALWSLSVPVEIVLTQEAVPFDVSRGSHLSLVIRRGLVEVSAAGTASGDADVGGLVQVVLASSGRAIPARLEDKDHAVAVGLP
jgi:hypothetical protein